MAEIVEDEQKTYDTPEGPVVEEKKVIKAELDTFARIIQEKFAEARDYRRDHEQHWQEAYDAYRAKYPSHINKANELANERGIFVNQTRRKVNSAKIKIGTLLFEDGEVPFTVTPSKRPRFFPPDIQVQPDRPDILQDALLARATNMEDKIRDILKKTSYNEEITHSIHEMCLYGTGCTKGVSLTRKNFPVYTSVRTPDEMVEMSHSLRKNLFLRLNTFRYGMFFHHLRQVIPKTQTTLFNAVLLVRFNFVLWSVLVKDTSWTWSRKLSVGMKEGFMAMMRASTPKSLMKRLQGKSKT